MIRCGVQLESSVQEKGEGQQLLPYLDFRSNPIYFSCIKTYKYAFTRSSGSNSLGNEQ